MPANNIVVIQDSPLNPVQFVDAEFAQHPSYHSLYSGQDWEEKTYAPGQAKIPYKYPAEMADPFEFQFHNSYNGVYSPMRLQMFRVTNRNGKKIGLPFYTFPAPIITALAGNSYPVPNSTIGTPLVTAIFRGTYAQIPNITPGIYYLVLTIDYDDSFTGTVNRSHSKKSGHIDLRWSHPKTILIKATNRTNDYNTNFVDKSSAFWGRVPGTILDYNPNSEDGSYENQRGKTRKTFSDPDSFKTLVIGGGKGVPQWVKAWANYAMSCDFKSVNNIEITKDENSQWETIGAGPIYPLGGISMVIKEAERERPYTTVIYGYLTLFTRPAKYPYQVVRVRMQQPTGPIVTLGSNFLITSKLDEDRMLQRLQAQINIQGLKGHVSFVNNELRYINNYTEQFYISLTVILNKFISVQYDPSYGNVGFTMDASNVAVDWGDGGFDIYGTGSTTSIFALHSYAVGTPIVNIKVFHSGSSITTFTSSNMGVLGIGGEVPIPLTSLRVINSQVSAFDAKMLIPASKSLLTLEIRNNKIATLIDFPGVLNAASPNNFTVLKNVILRFNRLNTNYVDEVLTTVNNLSIASNITNGTLQLEGQVPPAPPTSIAPGSPYFNLVNARNWTVSID